MELVGLPLGLCAAGIGLLAALGVGVLVLIKLGVITQYAFKQEPPDEGDYGLDQSSEVGE
jgi:hypothetical protein